MAAPDVYVSVFSPEESFRDTNEISMDVTHHMPVTLAVFPASTIDELRALRDKGDVVKAERVTLRVTIRTMGAVETSLHNRMRDEIQTRIEIERQLALVQEEQTQSRMSHGQDREDFKKLEDFMTSQFGYPP
ncbi:hypothetical protein Tco_1517974 [Tanacetum coccineum]